MGGVFRHVRRGDLTAYRRRLSQEPLASLEFALMSSQGQYGSGAHDAPQGPPNVYHPSAAPAPSYEQYADPAAAHGWQNAYDETAQLPPIREEGPGPDGVPGGWTAPAGDGPESGTRSGGAGTRAAARRAQRRRGGRRRVAVAGGAVAAVSVAALLAAFSFSGSPSEGTEGHQDPSPAPSAADSSPDDEDEATSPAPPETTDTVPQPPSSPTTSTPATAEPTATTSQTKPTDPGTTTPARTPTPPESTTPTPTTEPSATPTSRPGHGPGGPKHPK